MTLSVCRSMTLSVRPYRTPLHVSAHRRCLVTVPVYLSVPFLSTSPFRSCLPLRSVPVYLSVPFLSTSPFRFIACHVRRLSCRRHVSFPSLSACFRTPSIVLAVPRSIVFVPSVCRTPLWLCLPLRLRLPLSCL